VENAWPGTDLPAYCKACKGCDASKGEICPRPIVLPENVPALRAYDLCGTQWRVAFGGAVGLDYPACIATLERYVPRWEKEQPTAEPLDVLDLLDDLRTIEQALLTAWAENAEKRKTEKADE